MPDKDAIENQIKVLVNEATKEPFKAFDERMKATEERFTKGLNELLNQIRERDDRLLDNLMIRIHPLLSAIRDEAVEQARVNSAKLFERVFNFDPLNNTDVKMAQQIWSHSERRMAEAETTRVTAKQVFISKTVGNLTNAIWGILGAAVALILMFAKSYWPFFFGGRE